MQEEIMYLGFVISVDGLKLDPNKVKENLEWPTPKNVGEVRSFMVWLVFTESLYRIIVLFVML